MSETPEEHFSYRHNLAWQELILARNTFLGEDYDLAQTLLQIENDLIALGWISGDMIPAVIQKTEVSAIDSMPWYVAVCNYRLLQSAMFYESGAWSLGEALNMVDNVIAMLTGLKFTYVVGQNQKRSLSQQNRDNRTEIQESVKRCVVGKVNAYRKEHGTNIIKAVEALKKSGDLDEKFPYNSICKWINKFSNAL